MDPATETAQRRASLRQRARKHIGVPLTLISPRAPIRACPVFPPTIQTTTPRAAQAASPPPTPAANRAPEAAKPNDHADADPVVAADADEPPPPSPPLPPQPAPIPQSPLP